MESDNYKSFNAFVAFVSNSGLGNVIDQLLAFKNKGGEIKLYLGVNLNATYKEALEQLIEHQIESYVVYSTNNVIYHPKIYAFEGAETTRAIIGSSNLTVNGLFQNIEASVCIDIESGDENGSEFIAEIYDHFNSIVNQEHQSCHLLTQAVLEILIEKITIFSKPSLGQNGGFQNKILLFTNIDNVNFRLEILEQDEMRKLIENSSEWAKGGSGNGRAYGIISK